MHSDDGLKARIEEAEKDLLFYLRKYHELTSRSKFMKDLRKNLRNLESIIDQKGSPPPGQRESFPFMCNSKNRIIWIK